MCSRANMPDIYGESIIVRSNFVSTLLTLRGKELGVTGSLMLYGLIMRALMAC